ncbi:two-component sensor pilS [hydrocarbon metagenome]|uniref:Two-component sensor pilS n=1 Tax=hydrocarbon metagenome TaxID=938273 RepID=A0A0W8FUN4_9ZZZZ
MIKRENGMPVLNNEALTKEKNTRRLFFLIVSRVILVTLLLGTIVFLDIRKQEFSISQITINFYYFVTAAFYFFSVVYIVLAKLFKNIRSNIFLQLTVDIVLITFLVGLTDNIQIDYSLFYTLVIIYSVPFLGRKGGLIIASVASVFYGVLVGLKFFDLLPFVSSLTYYYNLNFYDILTNILVHVVSFYILAFLAGFAVEQEKKTRSLLEEKESEFNQLDLLFRSIIESVYTGVMTVDLRNVIKTFNKAAEEITGFSRSKVVDLKVDDVFPEFLPFMDTEMIDKQFKNRIEVLITGGNGANVNLGLSVSPLKGRNENEIGSILIFQDLTQITEMEKKLEMNKKMAIIGEMAAGWAHEVRNPLAAITGSIELLKKGLELEGTNKRLMEIILRSKDQLDSFARDFLLLARSVPASRESVDLKEVIEEVLEHIKLSPEWKDEIRVEKKVTVNIKAFANKEQVRQIINNLVLNAVQSMEEDGVLSVETKTVELDDEKKYAEIKIMDTGCGISKEDLARVFEPFFTNKTKGTGLGLTIVNHIVDGYNGKIKIDSSINKGTVCCVWLPVK